jgi:hypothetical protein
MSEYILPITLAVLFLFAAESRANNIVVNGDFEGGTYSEYGDAVPSGWWLSPVDDVSLSNCNVSGSVNALFDLGPESGTHYLAFAADETDGSQDCLYQDLPTVAGQLYQITFWVALTSGSLGANAYLDPEWDQGGANDTFMRNSSYYGSSATNAPESYEMFSFDETASQSSTVLYFHGVDANGGTIMVDNVSVSPIPEPSAWGLLALGSAGFLAWRAHRKRATSIAL